MKNNLQAILFQKYQDKNLASLYILNYDSRKIDPAEWVNEFMAQFTKASDHPDILKVHKAENETEYKVDSNGIREFLKFINYSPLQLEKKFIFIFNAQDISLILSNKLLKVFEELGFNFCLFLMVPDKAPMLPTVLSRAIKLQIPHSRKLTEDVPKLSVINTPQELLANLKQSHDSDLLSNEKRFIEQAIDRQLSESKLSAESFKNLDELLKTLADYEVASNFNNSKLARLSRFFS